MYMYTYTGIYSIYIIVYIHYEYMMVYIMYKVLFLHIVFESTASPTHLGTPPQAVPSQPHWWRPGRLLWWFQRSSPPPCPVNLHEKSKRSLCLWETLHPHPGKDHQVISCQIYINWFHDFIPFQSISVLFQSSFSLWTSGMVITATASAPFMFRHPDISSMERSYSGGSWIA